MEFCIKKKSISACWKPERMFIGVQDLTDDDKKLLMAYFIENISFIVTWGLFHNLSEQMFWEKLLRNEAKEASNRLKIWDLWCGFNKLNHLEFFHLATICRMRFVK